MEELLFRGHPEVVDADLADYFGSISHAELLKLSLNGSRNSARWLEDLLLKAGHQSDRLNI